MNKTLYLIDEAFQAIEESKFGRFRFCVEELSAGLGDLTSTREEDPKFGLILLVEKSMLSDIDRRFKELSMAVLRRLRKEAVGNTKVICESLLSLFLGCRACNLKNGEDDIALQAERESLPEYDDLAPDEESFLALWYWSRYWYRKYQSPCCLYVFLERMFFEQIEDDYALLDDVFDADLPAEFFRKYAPIDDGRSWVQAFRRFLVQRVA